MVTERVRIVVSDRGTRTVKSNLRGIGTTAKVASGNVNLLKASLLGLSVGLVARNVFNQFRQFEQSLSTVKAITEATDNQFKQMTESARTLGATTRFTATQAADAMVFLGRTGFDTQEILASIGPALLLAQAGALEFSRAADIATNVLKGFRQEADQMGRVVDVLTKAANSSNTSVEQMGNAMSFVAPVARVMGLSIEETAAAIGVLSDAGIQGERAGTGLRRVLAELEAPSTKSIKIINGLGLSLEDVRPSTVGLTKALQNLNEAGATGLGLQIFKQRGGPAFEVMAAGVGQLKNLNKQFLNADGTAKKVATTMDDNLNGAFLQLISAAQELAFSFQDSFLGKGLENGVRGAATAVRFLADRMDELKIIIIGTGIALLALKAGAIFAALASAIETAQIAMLLFNAAVAANPLGAIAIAIGAVLSLLVFFKDDIVIISATGTTLGDIFSATWGFFVDGISGALSFIGQFIPALGSMESVVDFIGAAFKTTFNIAITFFDVIIQGPVLFIRAALKAFDALPAGMQNAGRKGANALIDAFEGVLKGIVGVLNKIPGLGGIESPEFTRFKINAKSNGKNVGIEFLKGLKEAALSGPLRKAVDAVLDRASAISKARKAGEITSGGFDESVILKETEATKKSTGANLLRANSIAEVNKKLDEELRLLGLGSEERAIQERLLEITNNFKSKGITLSKEEIKGFRDRIKAINEMSDAVDRQEALLEKIEGPAKEYGKNLAALGVLLEDDKISTEQFTIASNDLRIQFLDNVNTMEAGIERGALKIGKQFTDVASVAESAMLNAFKNMEDGLVDFVATGEFNFKNFVNSLIKDISRIAVRQAITGPLAGAIGGAFSGGAIQGTGEFDGGGGGGGIASLIGGFSSLFGAKDGLDMTVGGPSGVDNQLLALRVGSGERVQVTPANGGGSNDRPIVVQMTVNTPDANSFKRSEGQIGNRLGVGIKRTMRRNG